MLFYSVKFVFTPWNLFAANTTMYRTIPYFLKLNFRVLLRCFFIPTLGRINWMTGGSITSNVGFLDFFVNEVY